MKKLVTLVLCLFALNSVFGQSAANYAFSSATNGSLIDMSAGTTDLLTTGTYYDDVASTVANIGFSFYFMGVPYTQFSINSNGQMQLGGTAIGGVSQSPAAGLAKIAPISGDNAIRTTGKVHYKVTGTSPNQVLVVEWTDLRINFSSAAESGTYCQIQALLYESTSIIEFRYGRMYNMSTSAQTRGIYFSSGVNAGQIGQITTINTTPTYNSTATSLTTTSFPASSSMTNLNSLADGSRTVFTFTPVAITPADPTSLTFTAVTASTTTLNWVDNSIDENLFTITRATDAAFTQNVFFTTVASTTTATTGTAYNSSQVGLMPSTLYYYKIQAATEGAGSTGLTGSQATPDAITYYWVGATGSTWNTPANWNTAADGTGTNRDVVAPSDVLIVDGAGTIAGAATTINVDLASFSIGQFLVTSNTACTLQSSAVTTRTITITGAPGDDFILENGSTLNLTNATNAVAFAFSGIGNTGTIAGTYNASSSTSNVINTTGGTGTMITVTTTGVINNSIVGSSGCILGSIATLAFANGSSYAHSGFTSSNGFIPLATWGANSNITIAGGTSSTGITNAPGQTLGNFTYNSTTSTGTMSAFTSSTTTVIQGNLNILSSNTGKLRIVTTGNLTINGNLNISGGTAEVSNNTGTVNVLGNVNVSGGTFDIAFASTPTLKVAGNFIQTAGNIIQTSATGILEFNGTSLQTLTLIPGSHGTNAINARINNTAGVDLTSAFSIRNLQVMKGNLTGAGALTYNGTTSVLTYNSTTGNQTANSFEFPVINGPSSITINNTTVTPNNVVTIPFSRSLGIGGVLTLTAGILDNTGYVLSLLNTAVGGVSGGSAASFVKGVITRDLPASLVTGSTYVFPVGKSVYNPFALVNPTTNAGGTVTVQAEVFDANCNGTAGSLIGTLHTNRYWAASITNGIGNFTNSLIQLNDSTHGADAVAASTTQTGTYDIVGGTAITATATSLTTTAPEATTLPGFFVMGNKAAATLTNLAITPSGNLCTNASRTVTVTVTPGGGAITGVVIDYSINGVAQTAINMTNITGNDWSGVIPTVTPANANVTWSVTATDANLLTKTALGTPFTDEPLFGVTAIANASLTTVCSGSPTVLNVSLNKPGDATIGAASTLTGATSQPTAFCNRWSSYRMQTIYTAAELTASGLSAGPISAMAYTITTLGDGATNANFTVKIGTTTQTAFTDFISSTGFTTVFPAAIYTHAIGVNTILFSTPYNWDGTSNLVVEVGHDGANLTNNAQTYYTATTGVNSVVFSYNGTTTGTTSTNRLNTVFTGNTAPTPLSYSWSDGATVVGTTNPLTVNPTSSTNYTATATVSGCPVVSNTVSVTTNPLPATPTANNSSQCGTAVPICSVTSNSGAPSPIFNWYLVPTGGTPISGITGNTYTGVPIAITTIFYVAEYDGTCESVRVPVTATVGAAPALTITPNQTVCNNSVAILTVTSTLADYDNYTWSPIDDLYTDAACTVPYVASTNYSTVYVKSATGITRTYTCNSLNTVTLCTNIATTDVTTLPASSQTVSINGNDFCLSGSSVLSATPTTGYGSATFQWQNSTDNILFNDILGATSTTYNTPTITSTTYYKILVKLGATVCSESNVATINVNNPQVVSTTPGTRCGTGIVTLGATGSAGTDIYWYAAATGGLSLYTGTSFVTPDISATTDYYVSAVSGFSSYNVGAPNTSISASLSSQTTTTSGINFDILTSGVIINSIDIYPTAAIGSSFTFTVKQGATVITTYSGVTTVQGTALAPVVQTVPVNFEIPAGTGYQITATTNPGIIRNSGGDAFPYTVAGVISLTSSTVGTYYYNFYNWVVSVGCGSARTLVTATVNTAPAITATATPAIICAGSSTTLEVSSSNTGYTYTWTPATTPATGASVTGSPVSTTVYTVNALDNSGGANDGCAAIATVNVIVNPTPTSVTATASDNTICNGTAIDLFSSAISGITSPATILTESFENAGAIPTGWGTDLDVDGNATNAALTFVTSSANPTGFSAYDGTYFVRFNSYSVQSGNSARLKQTSSFSTVGYSSLTVSFAWTQDDGYTTDIDNVVLQYSTDGTTWTTAGTPITRVGTSDVWTPQSVNLPVAAENQGTLYIAFLFTSAYGNDCHLDNVVINGQSPVPATFAWTSNPAGFTSPVQNPTGVIPTDTTTYTVLASNSFGCNASANVTVNMNPIPVAPSVAVVDNCGNSTLTASAYTGSLEWNTIETTPSIIVTSAGTYTVNQTVDGCTSPNGSGIAAPLTVPVVNLGTDITICGDQSTVLDAGNPGASYLWTPGGQNTQTITVDSLGLGIGPHTFSVLVTGPNTCTATGSVIVTFDPCTGIEANNGNIMVSIVPNPSNGMFYLNVEGINEAVTLNIYTINGKVIYSEQVDNTGLINKPIDLQSYPKGMYFLRLINNNMTHTEKIIIE